MMATMRGDSGEAKPKMDSLIDQVDKLRREMDETRMYAKLILSRARKLEAEVAVMIEKCTEPEASFPEEVEVIDLEEEEAEGNSGGIREGQRPPMRGGNDELIQFKMGMRNDCGRIQGDVDNLLKLVQVLTSLGMESGSRANSKSADRSSSKSTYSVEPAYNMDGRRNLASAVGLIKTEDPNEKGGLSPSSPASTAHTGFSAGLEGMDGGRTSTTTDSLDVGGGQMFTVARKKRIPGKTKSGVAIVPRETEGSSYIHADAIDTDDPRTGNKAHGGQLRKRRICSKPDMSVTKEKRASRKRTPRQARSPRQQLEVPSRTRVGDVATGEPGSTTGFDAIGGRDNAPTVPSSPPGPSIQAQELSPETGSTSPKQTGVGTDRLVDLEMDSQSTSAIGHASNHVSPSLPPLNQPHTSCHEETPGHSASLTTQHSMNDDTTLDCIFCRKKFGSKKKLFEEHILSHIGERPNFCNLCPYESSDKSNLTRHLETHKSARERKFQCALCQKRFSRQDHLKQHITGVHEKKRPFQCEECPKAFPARNELKSHMLVHTGEKNHNCPLCDKKFVHKKSLDDHIRLHTGECPKCRFCGKSFNRLQTLQRHERSKHLK